MIDKELLEQITALHNEVEDLEKRLKKIENKDTKIVKDSVKSSSSQFPYTQHSCVIEGVEYPKSKRSKYIYRKQIKDKKRKLDKLINKIEYELNYIEDSEIRQIIRYKYEDNMNWVQIMFKMGYDSESKAKMKLQRFFEKNYKCDKCDDKRC